jgi:WD40 repeat protein
MEAQTKQFFKRIEVFPTQSNIVSITSNPQNSIFCVETTNGFVSIFSQDFKIMYQFAFEVPVWGLLSAFSPDGDFLILTERIQQEILIIEIETFHVTRVRRLARFSQFSVHFVPFKNFTIIKSFDFFKIVESMNQSKRIHRYEFSEGFFISTVIIDSKNKIMYAFVTAPMILCIHTETMKILEIKENFQIHSYPEGSFLMKSGDLFIFNSRLQYILDKNCNVLREMGVYFTSLMNYAKFIDVVESENYIISILDNGMLIIQEPTTLCPLLNYQRKIKFSSILCLRGNSKNSQILTTSSDSSKVFVWHFHETPNILQLIKKNKLVDVQFNFKEMKWKQQALIVGSVKKMKDHDELDMPFKEEFNSESRIEHHLEKRKIVKTFILRKNANEPNSTILLKLFIFFVLILVYDLVFHPHLFSMWMEFLYQ